MKKKNLIMSVGTICAISCFLLSGCNGQKQIDNNKVEFIKVEEEVHLKDDKTSPACKFTLDYGYLVETNATDTISQRVNQTIADKILGKGYVGMPIETAVDSFKNAYINNYRKEVAELYEEDIKNGTSKESLPSWYNYEYSITTSFNEGWKGVINYTATTFEYSGGAHPNEWAQWLNFNSTTGELIKLNQVFMAGSEVPMGKLLLEELIKQMANNLPDETIQSLEDLQNVGILNDTQIYVPENFLLEKDQVSFLYNKYDIAPYAVGMIILSLPYTAVEKYMLNF